MAVATGREYGLFINGETVEGSSSRDLIEPASGEPFATAQLAGEAEIDQAVEAARASACRRMGKTPANERSRLLHALADALAANRKELTELESRNVGKAISSTKAELFGAVEHFRFFASAIATIAGLLQSDRRLETLVHVEGACRRRRPDRSVELPAADDHVEARTRTCSRLLRRARSPTRRRRQRRSGLLKPAAEVGFPAGTINVVPGDGPTTGAYLVRHPGVDKIAFMGPTKTGGEIMRLCSEPIKRLTWSSVARARTSSSPTPTWTLLSRARVWSIYDWPARAARRARGSSSRSRSTTTSWSRSPSRPATEDGRSARYRDADRLADL